MATETMPRQWIGRGWAGSLCLAAMRRMLAMALIMTASCHSPIAAAVSDEWCLDRGFDPSNLSCDTCALLEESTTLRSLQAEKNAKGDGEPIDLFAECRSCCQEYKVNPILHPGDSLRGKYRYALMTYNENSLNKYGEIKDFLERDVENVLSFKGEGFRAMKSERQDQDSYQMMMMMGIGGGGLSVPKLMLFEKRKKGGWTEEDEEEAGEVINLRNWKREDIKDMLLTLLPNA